jgi:PEP-CTERM putative exosortase interaction domain
MKKQILAVGALLATTCLINAAVLVGWDFDPLAGGGNDFGPSPYSPTTVASNVITGGLVRGSGVGTAGQGAGNAWGGNAFISGTFEDAVTGNKFATFTVQASPGYTLSFTSIDAYNVRRSNTGPTTGQWQYSLDGINFVNIGSEITWGATTTSAGNTQSAIDLSSITALQNLSDSTVVTFRVVTWGGSGATGTWYLNDPNGSPGIDFSVSGTISPVPEPASAVMLAGGVGMILLNFRRKRIS